MTDEVHFASLAVNTKIASFTLVMKHKNALMLQTPLRSTDAKV